MKIHPKKPVAGTQFGTTIHNSDPAKFKSGGHRGSKPNGVISQHTGEVFTENSTHIPSMNADKSPRESKVAKEHSTSVKLSEHDTACKLTATQSGSGGPTDRPYGLKDSYGKKGRG